MASAWDLTASGSAPANTDTSAISAWDVTAPPTVPIYAGPGNAEHATYIAPQATKPEEAPHRGQDHFWQMREPPWRACQPRLRPFLTLWPTCIWASAATNRGLLLPSPNIRPQKSRQRTLYSRTSTRLLGRTSSPISRRRCRVRFFRT